MVIQISKNIVSLSIYKIYLKWYTCLVSIILLGGLNLDNVLAERFSFLIKQSGLTYTQVAQALGIKSKGTISKYASRKN